MNLRILSQLGSILVALALGLALVNPGLGFAAQDEPAPEQPAAPAPAASPTPDRAPSYQRGAPAGALRLDGAPPAVGEVIAEDPLTSPGMIPGRITCPSGKNLGEFVGEGYIVKVAGRCRPESSSAAIVLPPIPDLDVPDGEIRVEVKVVSGHQRADIWIAFRSRTDPEQGYLLATVPAQGIAMLEKYSADAEVPLALRSDLAGQFSRDDWNEVAIRPDGQNIWVLLNGKAVLSVSDATLDRGGIAFGLKRLENPDDNVESAVVFRNLRVSRLAPK